jgi:hypothetical protein
LSKKHTPHVCATAFRAAFYMSRKHRPLRALPPVESVILKPVRSVKDRSQNNLAYALMHIIQKSCNITHTQFDSSETWFKTRDKINSQVVASLIASTPILTMCFYADGNSEMKCLVELCADKSTCDQYDIPLDFPPALFEGLTSKDAKNARGAIAFLHSVAIDLPELSTTLTPEPTCYTISINGFSFVDLRWMNFFVGSFENLVQCYTIGPTEDGLAIEINMRKVEAPPEYFANPIANEE